MAFTFLQTTMAGRNGNELFTVGYYDSTGKWMPESDHESLHAAADRCAFLNGGLPARPEDRIEGRGGRVFVYGMGEPLQ